MKQLYIHIRPFEPVDPSTCGPIHLSICPHLWLFARILSHCLSSYLLCTRLLHKAGQKHNQLGTQVRYQSLAILHERFELGH